MEYAILGNAAFFAVAFAMRMGWLSWDMLGFGQDDDMDDVAVKILIQSQIPKMRTTPITRRLIMPLSRWEHREMIPLAGQPVQILLRYLPKGNNRLVGSSSDDYFEGDAGNDTINGFNGNDAAYGGSGDDLFYGLGGDDTLYGDGGDDMIEGNTGDDNLFGGLGGDSIVDGGGKDVLDGGLGNHILGSYRLDSSADFSRGAGETLIGAEGEDTIIFSNADQVSGGAHADTFNYVYRDMTSDPVVITDFDKDIDTQTVHYTPQTDDQGNPIVPAMSFEIDASIGETLIKLEGVVVAKLQGDSQFPAWMLRWQNMMQPSLIGFNRL